MKQYFVTGIDTNVGKTIVSAILTEALEADYWKPIQAGDIDQTDVVTVQSLVTNTKSTFIQPQYQLKRPMSPHIAARKEGINIELDNIALPRTDQPLIVEGAGGLFCPINDSFFIIDLISKLKIPVILVSRNYLGSINHTLLSAALLKQRNVEVAGIVFNGEEMEGTEEIILQHTQYRVIGRINEEPHFSKEVIRSYASLFLPNLV